MISAIFTYLVLTYSHFQGCIVSFLIIFMHIFMKFITTKTLLMKQILLIICAFGFFNLTSAQDKWTAPEDSKSLVSPLGDQKAAAAAGKRVFRSTCMLCHGPRGEGNGPGGAGLNPKPANFTTKEVQGQSDGELFWKMSNGRNDMAAFKDSLTEEQRWQLVAYIRTFAK